MCSMLVDGQRNEHNGIPGQAGAILVKGSERDYELNFYWDSTEDGEKKEQASTNLKIMHI